MSQRIDSLSRAQLIGGVIATGALAACGGGVNTTAVSPGSATIAPNCVAASTSPAGVNQIFSDPVFKDLDKAALVEIFDPTPQIQALYQGYFAQAGQQLQIDTGGPAHSERRHCDPIARNVHVWR